jgi:putative membrane protein
MMWFGGGPFYHAWYGIGGMAMMFVFFFIAIAALFFAVRWIFGYNGCGINHMHQNNNDALEILKTRYAKGEITKDEFEEMKKHL